LLDKRLLFVTGKGGVGKTTVACGLAWLSAQMGKKTLISEVYPTQDLSEAFGCQKTEFVPKKITENLWAMSMDTEASLREYLRLNFKIPIVGRIGPVAKAFEFVSVAAPGVREILTIGKYTYEAKVRNYDCIIVDSPPSGHIVGNLSAPKAINELVKVGPVRSQTSWMIDILKDPRQTGVVIVTTPEEMPVTETIELANRIKKETVVNVCAIVVNQVLPELFASKEQEVFDELKKNSKPLSNVIAEFDALLSAADLAVTLRRSRAEHLAELRQKIDPQIPLLYLGYEFTKPEGIRQIAQIANGLGEELGVM
jgi:anion-transporting  ArsA/GET3 family ATPase